MARKMNKTGILASIVALVLGVGFGAQMGLAQATGGENGVVPGAPKDAAAITHPVARMKTPTYADVYCAGFIAPKPAAAWQGAAVSSGPGAGAGFAAGGVHTPNTTKFVNGDLIYLAGAGYQVGQRVMLVRELSHYERFALFPEQAAQIAAAGRPYADLGQARVVDTRSKLAIAHVDYTCEPMAPGDVVLPMEERGQPEPQEPFAFDRFAPPGNGLRGRILLARDSDELLGTGAAVYLNVGEGQGVKVGDHFRIRRAYAADLRDAADSLSFMAENGEVNQKHTPKIEPGNTSTGSGASGAQTSRKKRNQQPVIDVSDLPSRGLGEMVIVHVTATSATGVIGFALEDIHVGDEVERE